MGRFRHDDDLLLRNNDPWRGGKLVMWEEGVRVPMFVTWPQRIPAGATGFVAAQYDFSATFADLAGSTEPP